ncbi:MAG TPA: FAD-dependent oxidoreductase, partial [Pirellulales bacterium]
MNDLPNAEANGRSQPSSPVVVIGGGLAGLAATAALAERGIPVTLYESRQNLGGRAGSYIDAQSGEQIDNCQHVGMACCTNLADFCRRTNLDAGFVRHRTLYFFGRDGRCSKFRGSRGLPAPLHLTGGLLGLKYLSLRDRIRIGRSLMALGRMRPERLDPTQTIADFLDQRGEPQSARDGFWEVVLVS